MTDKLRDFARPVLRVARFEDHAIPVETLKEFAKYRELVFLVARKLYWDRTKFGKVPTGIKDCFQLKLRDVEHNCATWCSLSPAPSRRNSWMQEYSVTSMRRGTSLCAPSGPLKSARGSRRSSPRSTWRSLTGSAPACARTIELRGPLRDVLGPVYDCETRKYIKQVRTRSSFIKMAEFTGAIVNFYYSGLGGLPNPTSHRAVVNEDYNAD